MISNAEKISGLEAKIYLGFLPVGYKRVKDDGSESQLQNKLLIVTKTGLDALSNFGGVLSSGVSFLRHAPGQLQPLFEVFTGTDLTKLLAPVNGFVLYTDLIELPVNSVNYFVNGQVVKDFALKKFAAIGGQLALIPTNAMTWIWFLRDTGTASFAFLGDAATAIGNFRILGFVPMVVQAIPGANSVPYLAVFAETVGNARFFYFVGNITLLPACFTTLSVTYAFFAVQSYQDTITHKKKQDKIEGKLKTLNDWDNQEASVQDGYMEKWEELLEEDCNNNPWIPREQIDKDSWIKTCKDNNIEYFERRKIDREYKLSQARADFYAMVAKFIITTTILCGKGMLELAVFTTITANPILMGLLGAATMYCVAKSIYIKYNHQAYLAQLGKA
jgi:hypothetical protein